MRIAVLLIALSIPAIAGEHHWIDAKLTHISSSVSENGIVAMPIGNSLAAIPVRSSVMYYSFDTSQLNYVLATVNKRPLNVTINGTMPIAIEGQNGYIRDDSGKVQKLKLVVKRAK